MYLCRLRKSDENYNLEDLNRDNNFIYWQNANAIHDFLIKNSSDYDEDIPDNCFNNRYLRILPESLIKLRDICQDIVDNSTLEGEGHELFKKIKDPTKAKELLPTKEGFFWGDTRYNGFYLNALKDTIKYLNFILADKNRDKYKYYYHSSW